jgi:hypothetical protein
MFSAVFLASVYQTCIHADTPDFPYLVILGSDQLSVSVSEVPRGRSENHGTPWRGERLV